MFIQAQHFPPEAMELPFESCALCISPISYHAYAKNNLQGPIVKNVVAKCGPDVIATACRSMLLAAEDPVWMRGVSNILILVHEGSTWKMHKAFVKNGAYNAVVQGYWRVSRKPERSEAEISTLATLRAMLLAGLVFTQNIL